MLGRLLISLVFSLNLLSGAQAHTHSSSSELSLMENARRFQLFYGIFLDEFEKALDVEPSKIISAQQDSRAHHSAHLETFFHIGTYSILIKSWDYQIEVQPAGVLQTALQRYEHELKNTASFSIALKEPEPPSTRIGRIAEKTWKAVRFLVPSTQFFAESAGKMARSGIAFGLVFASIEFVEHSVFHVPPGAGPICSLTAMLAAALTSWTEPFRYLTLKNPHALTLKEIVANAFWIPMHQMKSFWANRKAKFHEIGIVRKKDQRQEDPVIAEIFDSKLWAEAWLANHQKNFHSSDHDHHHEEERASISNLKSGGLSLQDVSGLLEHFYLSLQLSRKLLETMFEGRAITRREYILREIRLSKYEKVLDRFGETLHILSRSQSRTTAEDRLMTRQILGEAMGLLRQLTVKTSPSLDSDLQKTFKKLRNDVKSFRSGKHRCLEFVKALA